MGAEESESEGELITTDILQAIKGFLSLAEDEPRKLTDQEFIENHLGFEYPDEAILEADLADEGTQEAIALALKEEDETPGDGPEGALEEEPGEATTLELDAKKSDYTPEQWASATIVHTGKFDSLSKSDHQIPVRKPDGSLDPGLMAQAVKTLFGSDIDQEKKRRAARELMFLYREIDDNPPDSLKGLAGRVERFDMAVEASEDTYVYQLPYELSEAKPLGKRLYKKTLAEVGRKIHYDGKVLDYSRSALEKWVKNFKAKAFPQVPLLSEHTKNVFAYLGELVDLSLEGKKVVGTFRVTEKAATLLEENPNLSTSVGYLENFVRKSDKKKFGPTLQHIATTFTPHDHKVGLEPWEQLQLSSEANVVDLTQAEFTVDIQRKESGPVEDKPPETNEEVRETVELSADAQAAIKLAQDRADQALEELQQYKELSQNTAKELLEQKVERELDEYRQAGVPPAFINKARPVLLSEAAATSLEVVELSQEDGEPKATKKTVSIADQTRSMLDFMRGTVDLSEEQGRSDVEPADDSDEATHKKIEAHAKENNLSYRDAYIELSQQGEVSL